MKKILLVLGIVVISALVFAHGSGRGSTGRGGFYNRGYMMEEYAEKKLSGDDYKKFEAMRNKHFQENEKLAIEIRAKNLDIKRLRIQEKVDWEKVHKLNSEKYKLLEKQENNRFKHMEEMRKTFGDDFTGRGYHMMDDDRYERQHMMRY